MGYALHEPYPPLDIIYRAVSYCTGAIRLLYGRGLHKFYWASCGKCAFALLTSAVSRSRDSRAQSAPREGLGGERGPAADVLSYLLLVLSAPGSLLEQLLQRLLADLHAPLVVALAPFSVLQSKGRTTSRALVELSSNLENKCNQIRESRICFATQNTHTKTGFWRGC